MAELLADDLQRTGAGENPPQLLHPLPGVAVSHAVGALRPAQRPLRGAREAGAPRGAGGGVVARHVACWWRRRESNPRPQALRLRLYMLSRVYLGLADPAPDGQGSGPASPWGLVIQVGAAFTTIS